MPGKHHLRGFKIAKKIGSWICDMCIDARKTSLTGVQNSKKNRLAATRLVDDAPPWKKARSAAGMWGKNVFFFVMLLPRGKILISSAKYWFLGMRILKSSNTTWQLCGSAPAMYGTSGIVFMHALFMITYTVQIQKHAHMCSYSAKNFVMYSLNKKEWICSVLKEWILEKWN